MSQKPVEDLATKMNSQFGPVIFGKDLYSALGFKTYAAFHRSNSLGELGVHVFKLTGRRGWFALTGDVAKWLENQSLKPYEA